ncbi:SafA/ExsA family spore coat assembly protein [Natranaerofaba carboxydovora]|uniref:SafA/ExsA family spore coat assembly protein n=1 Tax=Natranaerofaba carboxydovora TaxID=2742683 RepID=UPI001F146B0A|nr:SafA/ExsA family spore coat assembly protein [Natranaerofaba carboxydovora]UMZ72572.1 SpoIVD-associated factor A [Natranaerofaba carboxydovora]
MSYHKKRPRKCDGFLYTVKPGDTLFLIAKKFSVSLNDLIKANPQIKNPDMIFPGQEICIPKEEPEPDEVPEVLSVEFLDRKGRELPERRGFVKLDKRTTVVVEFSKPVDEVFFLFIPKYEDNIEEIVLLESVDAMGEEVVEFEWEVPDKIKGYLFVIGCQDDVCGRSENFGVIRKRRRKRRRKRDNPSGLEEDVMDDFDYEDGLDY